MKGRDNLTFLRANLPMYKRPRVEKKKENNGKLQWKDYLRRLVLVRGMFS